MDNSNATNIKFHYSSLQCQQKISGFSILQVQNPSQSQLRHIHLGQWSSPGNRSHVVAWEDAGHSAPQRCPLEPAVLALLNDPVHLTFAELQLVILLRLVGVQG